MSIATRITSIEGHIEQAYDELQGLGADLTNVDKNIENISMVLDDIYDSMPQVSGEGTSLTLNDTRVGKIKSTLKGNTSQTGTPTPSSPIPVNVVSGDNEIVVSGHNLFNKSTIIEGKYIDGSGNFVTDSDNFISDFIPINSANNYYVSASTLQPKRIAYYNSSQTFISRQLISATGGTLTIPTNAYYLRLSCYNVDLDSLQLEYGTTKTTYQSFNGLDTYNIDLPVENKCNITTVSAYGYSEGIPTTQVTNLIIDSFDSNNITYHSTTADYCYALTNVIQLSPSTTYTISFSRTTSATNNQFFIYDYDNGTYTVNYRDNNTNVFTKTFTTNSVGKIALAFGPSNTIGSTTISNIMIEQGSKQNAFTPYGTTPIELCSSQDGTKRDYLLHDKTLDKWYWHRDIGKVVLNGSENISIYNQNTNRTNFQVDILTGIESYLGFENVPNLLSNMFNAVSQSITWVVGNISRRREAQTTLYLTYEPSTTIDQFKNWLSTHNVNVYYIFATPTNTEITYQPLIDQLNELEKAMSKEGQTNISQVNNDLPFIISASALKEWQESASLSSTLSMVNPLSLGNTLNTQEDNIQPIEVDNIEPLEEEENEES